MRPHPPAKVPEVMMKALVRSATAAALFALVFVTDVPSAFQQPATPPTAPPQAPPAGAPAAPAAGAPQEPGRGGRGGGRGSQMVALYTERCAACHGTDTAAGRAPNLFDDQWARAKDDEGIAKLIADGVPQTEMIPFKDQLTDQQIWQLVAYLKTA